MTAAPGSPGAPRYRPISRRFALRMISLTLTLLFLLGATESYFGYLESIDHIEAAQELQADNAAREIASYLDNIRNGLREVAKMPWGQPGFGGAERRQEYYRLMQQAPAITELQTVDPDGRERLLVSRMQTDSFQTGKPIEEPELARVGAAEMVRQGKTFFRDELPMARLSAFDGQGAVVATVDLRRLGEIVSRIQAGEGGLAYVIDENGLLIAHPRSTHVLARRDLSQTDLFLKTRQARSSTPVLLRGYATFDLMGKPVIATAAAVPGASWTVIMEQQRAQALKPAWATLSRTLLLMAVGAAAALLTGIAFARRMAAPIVALRNATAQIAAGDLGARLAVDGHDEIADLANDFNQMVQRLRELYASLEVKVVARTRELSDARDALEDRAHEIDLLNQRLMTQLDELSLRKEEAERANAAKTRFLAAASHDLRQPMHSISLLVGVLRARLHDPAEIDLADKVQSSVTTMENLFGNLLDISKLDAGAVHAHVEDVDLSWMLERAAHTWLPQAQEKGLSLRVHPGRWVVRGDATLLERIIGNLLANAIRYTRTGGVLIGCRRRGDRCELQVWDTGPGIAEKHREAIFEEFFRIGAPGTGQEKGLGLGLSIVRRCVHILDYSIAVQSSEGHGSVFKVTLPLVAGAVRPQPTSGSADTQAHALEGNFVLVVDDEATNREAVRDALLAAGCHVVVAAGGDEAFAELEAHLRTPDLILTDYQLGVAEHGLDLIRRLREHYDEAIPALVVTANTDTRLLADTAALGAALLHKPVGLQRLLAAIKDSLEARV